MLLQTNFQTTKAATDFFISQTNLTSAQQACVVAFLNQRGMTNRDIRSALCIDKVYTVTHLKRTGTALSLIELELWHQNPDRISLGHVRAITKLPMEQRESLLRELLVRKIPVSHFEAIAKGKHIETDADIKRFERVIGDMLSREIEVQYNQKTGSGCLSLSFTGLDDLEQMTAALRQVQSHIDF